MLERMQQDEQPKFFQSRACYANLRKMSASTPLVPSKSTSWQAGSESTRVNAEVRKI